jgi:hypothetical protein
MFEPTFNPYDLLVELLERTQELEQANANLVKVINQHSQMLNSMSQAHLSLSKQHQELVKYITDREIANGTQTRNIKD